MLLGGIVLLANKEQTMLGFGLICGCLLLAIVAIQFTRRLTASKIDDKLVYAKGCNPVFLETLPVLPEQR